MQAKVAFKTTVSDELMAEAKTLMPGGVSSPVRAFKSVGGNPVVFDRVKGSKAYDVDGNEYVDYVGTWGPAIVGHADDRVLDSLKVSSATPAPWCLRTPADEPCVRAPGVAIEITS